MVKPFVTLEGFMRSGATFLEENDRPETGCSGLSGMAGLRTGWGSGGQLDQVLGAHVRRWVSPHPPSITRNRFTFNHNIDERRLSRRRIDHQETGGYLAGARRVYAVRLLFACVTYFY